MPWFPLVALGMGLLSALPAAAQNATHTGGCAPHAGDQLRCAVQVPMLIASNAYPTLTIVGNGQITGDWQRWFSQCGSPGEANSISRISNANASLRLAMRPIGGLSLYCVEVFFFNCRDQSGQAVPCQRGFGASQLQVRVGGG